MEINSEKIKNFFKSSGKKIWAYIKLAKIELIIIAGIIFLDLLTKFIVDKTMFVGQTIVIIPKFLEFYYTINTKAAFGSAFGLENILGQEGIRITFLIITVIAVGAFGFFLYYFRGKHILARVSLALIISGAFGNFCDRLFFVHATGIRGVRDFIQIVFFGLDLPLLGESFAIFNIADIALVAGVIIFAVYFIFMYKTPKEAFVGPVQQFGDKENGGGASNKDIENDDGETGGIKQEIAKDDPVKTGGRGETQKERIIL